MLLRTEVLQLAHRCTGTLTYVIISALGARTDATLTHFEGMCAAVLLFVVVEVLVDSFFTSGAKSTMLKQVCLLYCTQRARTLFSSDSESMSGLLSNLFLAVALALSLIFMLDTSTTGHRVGMCGGDLRGALQGLVYMYADMFDFAFRYGVFKITLFSFVAGLFLDRVKSSNDKIAVFSILLFKVICTNLTSQGFDLLITSDNPHLELFECLLAVAVLRLAMPSMGSYLVYLASVRVAMLVPGVQVLLLCALLWLDLLVPPCSRAWVGELCMAYIASGLANMLLAIPVAGALVLLIMVHYADLLMVHGGC